MRDQDYDDFYDGEGSDKGPALSAALIVVAAILILGGIGLSFSGSVQF